MHRSASDCATAGERQARCSSHMSLVHAEGAIRQKPGEACRLVMLPVAYADHAYLLERAGAPACLQWSRWDKAHSSFELRSCWSEMRALYMHKKICLWKMGNQAAATGEACHVAHSICGLCASTGAPVRLQWKRTRQSSS